MHSKGLIGRKVKYSVCAKVANEGKYVSSSIPHTGS